MLGDGEDVVVSAGVGVGVSAGVGVGDAVGVGELASLAGSGACESVEGGGDSDCAMARSCHSNISR